MTTTEIELFKTIVGEYEYYPVIFRDTFIEFQDGDGFYLYIRKDISFSYAIRKFIDIKVEEGKQLGKSTFLNEIKKLLEIPIN